MLVSKNWSFRSMLALGLMGLLSFGVVGCGTGDLPTASDVSVSPPPTVSVPSRAAVNPFVLNRPKQVNPSFRAPVSGKMQLLPAFELFRYNKPVVHSMSSAILRAWLEVNNDSSGYATPSANLVAHIRVDNSDWFVDQPDVWGSMAYVDIPLSPGPHSVALVEDYWATHTLEYNNFANVTVTSGQFIEQGAGFNDMDCAPSCP